MHYVLREAPADIKMFHLVQYAQTIHSIGCGQLVTDVSGIIFILNATTNSSVACQISFLKFFRKKLEQKCS
jgi:hypothetical protein